MLLDDIKKANIQAMKERDMIARNIYSVVLNKAMLENIKRRETGLEFKDSDMVAILQKTIKELSEELENYKKVGNDVETDIVKKEIELVEGFMPKMLNSDEIKKIILKLEDKSIPNVMKYFKTEYAGKCDMRIVSDVLKSLI